MDTWVWILIVGVVIVAVVAALMAGQQKRKTDQRRSTAEQLRTEAHENQHTLTDADREVRDAEARAAQARAEAQRAEQQAAEAARGRDMQQAEHENQIREADRIDPDVDHRSDDYQPQTEQQRFDTQTGQPLDGTHEAPQQQPAEPQQTQPNTEPNQTPPPPR